MATPLDPIWEFVFDDYDSGSDGAGKKKRGKWRKKAEFRSTTDQPRNDDGRFQLSNPNKTAQKPVEEGEEGEELSFIERLLSGSSLDDESSYRMDKRERGSVQGDLQQQSRKEARDDEDIQSRGSWTLAGSTMGSTASSRPQEERMKAPRSPRRKSLFSRKGADSRENEDRPDRAAASIDMVFDTTSTRPEQEPPLQARRSLFFRRDKVASESPTRRRSFFGGRGQTNDRRKINEESKVASPNSSWWVTSESPTRKHSGLLPRKSVPEEIDRERESDAFNDLMVSLGLISASGATVAVAKESTEEDNSKIQGKNPKSIFSRPKSKQKRTSKSSSPLPDDDSANSVKKSQNPDEKALYRSQVSGSTNSPAADSAGTAGVAGVVETTPTNSSVLVASARSNQKRKEVVQRDTLRSIKSIDTNDAIKYGYDTSFFHVSIFDEGDESSVISSSAPSSVPSSIPSTAPPALLASQIEGRDESNFWDLFSPSDETDGALSEVSATTEEFSDHGSTHSSVDDFGVSSNMQVRELMEDPCNQTAAGTMAAMVVGDASAQLTWAPEGVKTSGSEPDDKTLETVDNSVIDEPAEQARQARRGRQIRNKIGMVVCCRIKNGDRSEDLIQREERRKRSAIVADEDFVEPTDATHVEPPFPKIKMVADEKPSPKETVEEVVVKKGLQSLYEYEYETGTHMAVRYDFFSENAKGCITVNQFSTLPVVRVASNDITVQVEASTVSPTDCKIRRGDWRHDDGLMLPITPGVDMVGRLVGLDSKTAKKYKIRNGERVISLVKWGGNSRFRRVVPKHLVRVPEGVEPAQATCLAETYLSAYQVLHHSQRSGLRHKKDALSGKSIIVLGALSNLGRAAVELANAGGATFIYAPCSEKHRAAVREIGGAPLRRDVAEWLPHLEGKIDIIIDATGKFSTENLNKANVLNDKGAYFFVGEQSRRVDEIVEQWIGKSKNVVCSGRKNKHKLSSQIHGYDVFDSWKNNLETCKRDLAQLLKLLRREAICPRVLDRIPLGKLMKAHEVLDAKKLQGFLVCEPWIKSVQRAVLL